MNNQALRILATLPHTQLSCMYSDLVDQYNLYCHNNDDKDDIGGHIAMSCANMELDIALLHKALVASKLEILSGQNLIADLPF